MEHFSAMYSLLLEQVELHGKHAMMNPELSRMPYSVPSAHVHVWRLEAKRVVGGHAWQAVSPVVFVYEFLSHV